MEDNKIGYLLKKIVTVQFETIESAVIENELISIGVGFDFGISSENKMVVCFSRFQFVMHDIPFIVLHVNCEFKIDEAAWNDFLDIETNIIHFPKSFMSHLALTTLGTARGVLHTKTENTGFNQYVLPAMNENGLIKEDISISLDKQQIKPYPTRNSEINK